jgi:hypothetical protein
VTADESYAASAVRGSSRALLLSLMLDAATP